MNGVPLSLSSRPRPARPTISIFITAISAIPSSARPSGAEDVLLNFMLSQLEKHDPHVVFFDKDRGADLYVRAAAARICPSERIRPAAPP
ncbi:hypothetical protein F2981_19385 (plasmid) [Sinorhizobium meliloti]|nr:hypothetical protein [Sinorhizobium meliloti]